MKMSAEEFLDVASRLAALLSEVCSDSNQVIALDLDPELFAIATFACHRQGYAVCQFRSDLDALSSAKCTLVLTQNSEITCGPIPKLVLNQTAMEKLSKIHPVEPLNNIQKEDLACIFFSSGTTGVAKLIPVTYEDLFLREKFVRQARIRGNYMSLLGNGTFGGFMTMFSQIINAQPYLAPRTANQNLRVIKNWQVDHVFGSPAQLEALATSAIVDSESLDLVEIQSTGNLISRALVNKLSDLTGALVTNVYASTEAGVVAMKSGDWNDDSYCGEVLDGVELEVVDTDGKLVPNGSVGELRVRSPGQSRYYVGNPKESAKQFRDGWFYPGDLATLHGKSLYLMGRKLEIINAGGVKVNPIAMDHLACEHPDIDDAATFTFESKDGVMQIGMAFVSGNPPEPNLLRLYLARKFGDGAPQHFFRLAEIPRNELGKAKRNAIADAYKLKTSV
ncbi:MAG: fatty acid--CoA ligase family protein [Aquiluna sp.]|nr:fatty acid--CoA ligase family protein [Aquiluna sp.]MCF8545486.1 fatty acid--CoA ligase family protein [Aquiluna sp.]